MFSLIPHEPIVMVQSADPVSYFDMLRITSRPNRAFCMRHGIRYVCMHAVLHGYHPWHACYNRIVLLYQLMELGYKGWYMHLDADAYVHDIGFDISSYLQQHADRSLIIASGGSDIYWVVNDGIFFANLAHPAAHEIVRRWMADLQTITPAQLRADTGFEADLPADQALLHGVLRRDENLTSDFLRVEHKFINSGSASFIRQVLRVADPRPEYRLRRIAIGVEASLARHDEAGDNLDTLLLPLARALDAPMPEGIDLDRAHQDRAGLTGLLRVLAGDREPSEGAFLNNAYSSLLPALADALGISRPTWREVMDEFPQSQDDLETRVAIALISKRKKEVHSAKLAGCPIADPDRHIAALRAFIQARRDVRIEARWKASQGPER